MTDAEFIAALEAAQAGVDFDEAEHIYRRHGQIYNGVTSALRAINKPALLNWAARLAVETGDPKAHTKASKEATGIGRDFHALAEWWGYQQLGVEKVRPLAQNKAEKCFERFKAWALAHDFEPLAMERRVYHDDLRYAGTLDLVARIDGRLCVPDYKTSNAVYPETRLQNMAYRQALVSMGLPEIDGCIILVPKDGPPRFEWLDDPPEETFAAFKNALLLSRWLSRVT